MKTLTRILHRLVQYLGLDDAIAKHGSSLLLKKIIPLPSEYARRSYKLVTRDKVSFLLDVSDYMQWFVYASIPDKSWLHALQSIDSISDPVVLDVGANIGAFSLKVAANCNSRNKNVSIHSFEPSSYAYKRLLQNIDLNTVGATSIHPYKLAVGSKSGNAHLAINHNNTGGASIVDHSSGKRAANIEIVEMTTLDKFIEDHAISYVDFLKIDVEGFEPFVCLGASCILEKYRPTLYIEMTPEWHERHNYSSQKLIEYLSSLGYSHFLDDARKLSPLCESTGFDNLFQYNMLSIHPSRRSQVGV